MVNGAVIKLSNGGWQIAEGFVTTKQEKDYTPMDIAEQAIRKMIELR